MVVGVCKLQLLFHDTHSLKEKRMILRSIKDKVSQKFKVSVAEVEHQDLWQRTEIGFCVPGGNRRLVSEVLEKMIDFVEGLDLGQVTQRTVEVIDF